MWLRLISLPVLLLALQVSFPVDTAQTMCQRYGSPISETYLIKPGVVASVSFGSSGHVCEIVVSPENRDAVKSGNRKFKHEELTQVIDELVPMKERGKPMVGGFFNARCLPDDDCAGTYSDSEKVSIYRNGGIDGERYATMHWTRDECYPRVTK